MFPRERQGRQTRGSPTADAPELRRPVAQVPSARKRPFERCYVKNISRGETQRQDALRSISPPQLHETCMMSAPKTLVTDTISRERK
jgi:hypothetical protein